MTFAGPAPLNNKIPVFIHYQQDSNLLIGEIIYLNTKDKEAIKLLGTIEGDKSYRLLEFDKAGSITGIILGTAMEDNFNGQWYSPTSKKEFTLFLSAKDTTIKSPDITTTQNEIAGSYHYNYGPKGYNGDLTINKLSNNKFDFDIISLTNVARGPNIAQVEKDTIAMKGSSFTYKMPYSDSCEFKVSFYKGFVYVQTKGDCMGEFGMGATVDGIYLKGK